MLVAEWLRFAEARLAAAGVAAARLEAQQLASHILRVERIWLVAHGDHEFPDLAGERLLQRRESGEPLAYILGWREFYGRRFVVDRRVLIPRHETETLVHLAMQTPCDTILDLGTGSGILAITLKIERPEVVVTAVDVSPEALEVAVLNARDLGVDVRMLLSDGFSALQGERFDLIVTNPPYIGREEPLASEVADHEPQLALFADDHGFAFYDRLAAEAPAHLTPKGSMLMEVGYRQAAAVAKRFRRAGWRDVSIHPDMSLTDRVVGVAQPRPA